MYELCEFANTLERSPEVLLDQELPCRIHLNLVAK